MIQRSDEWYQARLGKVTASRINDVCAKLKNGGEAGTRKNYRTELLIERLTGKKSESYTNSAMQWGIDNEDSARAMYELITGNKVKEVGFIDHPTIRMSGASPDGLISSTGGLEIKCPNTATHIEYLGAGTVPSQHINQMIWQMVCTGRKWWDFVSFDPRLPDKLQLFIIRYKLDIKLAEEITKEVKIFLGELDELESKMREKIK